MIFLICFLYSDQASFNEYEVQGNCEVENIMWKIKSYKKQLQDEESPHHSELFEPVPMTAHQLKSQINIHIEKTQQNLCSLGNIQRLQLAVKEPFSPKVIQNSNLQQSSISVRQTTVGKLRQTRNKKKLEIRTSQQKCEQMLKKRKKWQQLKDVLTNQKINILKEIFVSKLKRNNPFSSPVQFVVGDQYKKQSFLEEEGIELSQGLEHALSIVLILQVMLSLFIYTLSLVFDEVSESTALFVVQAVSLLINLLQMGVNFSQQKTVSGRKVRTFRQIIRHYAGNNLITDSINIAAVLLSMATGMSVFNYFRLVVISKVPQILQRLQKLEIFVIDNYYNEQYWSLMKTFIFNFCFAHILAILLVAMTNLNQSVNWMTVKGVHDAPWAERYIWSYYWGTNIMLTVGFGDIVASTYQEAVCLIFIETISCLALAYNINCVGSLITNIRSQDIEKSKNFRVFKKLIIKNGLPEDLSWRINNYIEQSINIKKKFSLEEEKNFIEKLPNGFKKEVLKESNKNIFVKLTFFHSLMEKTLYSLAEKIEMCIYHPEEIIQPLEDNYNLYIVKAGEIGYISKRNESNHFNRVIDTKKIAPEDAPFLINLHFITKKRLNYEVKSLVYSVLYFLDHSKLISILEESPMDYELYSYLKDKNKNVIDEFEVFPCQYCKTKHTKFYCPKIHYIPITQHVVNRYLRAYGISRNQRSSIDVIRREKENVLTTYLYQKKYHQNEGETILRQRRHIQAKRKSDTQKLLNKIRVNRLNSITPDAQTAVHQAYVEKTTEVIREQFVKLMGTQMFEDEVWNLSLDKMRNYKGYFTLDNSSNLKEKFNCDKRRSKMLTKFKTLQQQLQEKYLFGRSSLELTHNIPVEFKQFQLSIQKPCLE